MTNLALQTTPEQNKSCAVAVVRSSCAFGRVLI
jgi:hypothetical protein